MTTCKIIKCYIFWVCDFSLRYSACKAHEPYCRLWPFRLYIIFPHYLINDTIFEIKNGVDLEMCVLIFCTICDRISSHYRKNSDRCYHICAYVFVSSNLDLTDFNQSWIFSTDFQNKKFHQYKISWKSL